MKLKSLLVITLLVIGCSFASASTFGFGTAGGSYLYCNYEVINPVAGDVWGGTDVLSTCYAPYNATVVGIKGGLSATGNPLGFSVKGVTYADNVYDAQSLYYTGAQWDVTSALKCAKFKNGRYSGKFGWIGFAAVSGYVFGDNYGFLTCQIPVKGKTPTKGLSTGSAKVPHHQK